MNRTETLRAKVTPAERRIAEVRSKQQGVKLSEYLRDLIRQDAKSAGCWKDVLAELREAA